MPTLDIWDTGSRTLRDIWRSTGVSPVPTLDRRDAGSCALRDIWRSTGVSPVPTLDRRDACPTPGFGQFGTGGTPVPAP
ncbi:MAG: hypothetical protein KME26_08655 [Oscillatoria princeps RMCB-10]|nr:hypothetical protein [Oscillatoria princeps RMCB-10]